MNLMLTSWESRARSIVRVVLSFTFSLHGYHHLWGVFAVPTGRRTAPMALDFLPSVFGVVEILGGTLLFLGLFTRSVAYILATEAFIAYAYSAAPRGLWPARNGGTETLIYAVVFLFFTAAGAGNWSLDSLLPMPSRRTFQPQ